MTAISEAITTCTVGVITIMLVAWFLLLVTLALTGSF
jgi:hypothetical protein